MKNELVIVLDFGGQYSNVIARRVRECGVYCEVKPYTASMDALLALAPKGFIFSGSSNSVYAEHAPSFDPALLEQGVPILGICYGAQLIAHLLGGKVSGADASEFGGAELRVTDPRSPLFGGVAERSTCWMSHTDYIERAPQGFAVTAATPTCPCAAMENAEKKLYAVQFHPEVEHTSFGRQIIVNFLTQVCRCSRDWKMGSYVERTIASLREQIGDKRVLCALSGGVDSTVAAVMAHKAVGNQLTCMFIDHGLLRKGEGDSVERVCREQFNMNFIRVNAEDYFLDRLAGVTDPERKRKIIGDGFIRVFEREGKKLGHFSYLVQGTIYPDIIESGGTGAAVIKSHHNVGGLPDAVDFDGIIEPLRQLFKDEVRRAGLELGIPEDVIWRQPFPGPGLAVRVIGDITKEKLDILRDADAIFREEVKKEGIHRDINQYFAVLTNMRSVGVMGDGRTYDYTIALRGVTTTDFMTADFARIPYDVLARVSSRIANEVGHVNRIVYDITPKPPATIEWE